MVYAKNKIKADFNIVNNKKSFSSSKSAYVTVDHKTSHKGQFSEIEIYTTSKSWINKLSLMYGLLW